MADESKRPIIIVKRKVYAAGHHGGAWKVAYADFVTAMMAFFMVMWLITAVAKDQRAAIFDYFKNPSMEDGKAPKTTALPASARAVPSQCAIQRNSTPRNADAGGRRSRAARRGGEGARPDGARRYRRQARRCALTHRTPRTWPLSVRCWNLRNRPAPLGHRARSDRPGSRLPVRR